VTLRWMVALVRQENRFLANWLRGFEEPCLAHTRRTGAGQLVHAGGEQTRDVDAENAQLAAAGFLGRQGKGPLASVTSGKNPLQRDRIVCVPHPDCPRRSDLVGRNRKTVPGRFDGGGSGLSLRTVLGPRVSKKAGEPPNQQPGPAQHQAQAAAAEPTWAPCSTGGSMKTARRRSPRRGKAVHEDGGNRS